jgi:acyl-CoA synthetase (AMP-forming)/AMP-acid ligase II
MLGERIEAVVVADQEGTFDEAALRDHCAARLPAYMVPKRIECRAELPRTASGKTDYAALRQAAGRQVDSPEP